MLFTGCTDIPAESQGLEHGFRCANVLPYHRHSTALAMLPALQKPFGRTGSEAQEDSTEEMQAM